MVGPTHRNALGSLVVLALGASGPALAQTDTTPLPDANAPSAGASPTPARSTSAGSSLASPDGFLGLKDGPPRTLDFNDVMSLAVKNNFDLRIAHERMFQSELLIRRAWAVVLPRLSANAQYTFNWPQVNFQAVTQETLDRQASAQRGSLESQAQVYEAQAEANRADGDYNTEYANRAIAAQLRRQASSINAGSAPDPVAINPVHVFTGGLTFSMVLFNGRAIPALLNAYDTVKQTRETMVRARSQALYAVAVGYFNAVAANRLVGIAQKQVTTLEHHLEVTRVRVEVGSLPRLAMRRAESDLERAKASVRSARNAYVSALGSLGMATGVDTMFDVGALPPVPQLEETVEASALVDHARRNRQDLVAARIAVDIADRNRVDAVMQWFPTLTLNSNARATSNIRGFQREPVTYAVVLNASLPLYDGGERYTAWRESGSRAREARLVLEQAEQRVEMAVRGNLREIALRKDNLTNQRAALKLAEEAAADAAARFEVGAATQLEVLDAEQAAISAALDLALAELELQTARLALAFVVGAFNPALGSGGTIAASVSPVDLAGVPSVAPVAHLEPTAAPAAPVLAPAGRASRGIPEGRTLSLQPTALDLLRTGLADPVTGLPVR